MANRWSLKLMSQDVSWMYLEEIYAFPSNIYLILITYPPWYWSHDGHDHYVHDQSISFKLLWWIIFLTAVCHWEVWVSLSISSLLCGPPTIKLYQFKDKIWTFLNIYQTKFCWLHLDRCVLVQLLQCRYFQDCGIPNCRISKIFAFHGFSLRHCQYKHTFWFRSQLKAETKTGWNQNMTQIPIPT